MSLQRKVYDSLSGRVAHRLLVNGQDLVSREKLAKGGAVSRDGAYNDRPLAACNEAEALSRVALDGDLSS